MKRLALLLSACLFLASCDKDPYKGGLADGFYAEDITYVSNGITTTFHQEFILSGDRMVYDPFSDANSKGGYIDFAYYAERGIVPFATIDGDYIPYTFRLTFHWLEFAPNLKIGGRVEPTKDGFRFSYPLLQDVVVTHECRRIDPLSD